MSPWTIFAWLVIAFLLLLPLNRWIATHVQGIGFQISNNATVAVWLYFILFLPGILLHELSHYITAFILQVKVEGFSLWPQAHRDGSLVLGSVTVRGAGPLRHSIIGAAPLFAGSLTVVLIAQFLGLNEIGRAVFLGDATYFSEVLQQSLGTPDFFLWFYLLFAVANAMLPSPADRLYWGPVLLFFVVIAVIAIGFDWLPELSPGFLDGLSSFFAFMATAFSTTVMVNLLAIALLALLEWGIGHITGRRVAY